MRTNHFLLLLAGISLVTLFQNCSPEQFSKTQSFTAQSPEGLPAPEATPPVTDNPPVATPTPGPTPDAPTATPTPTPAPSPTPRPHGNSDNNDNSSSDLVECQLGGANAKVILLTDFQTGSNAADTRVCMSKQSCLEVINNYAAAHGCALMDGQATTPGSTTQCTSIFPGSKGTCKNARVLSDDEVMSTLSSMSAK